MVDQTKTSTRLSVSHPAPKPELARDVQAFINWAHTTYAPLARDKKSVNKRDFQQQFGFSASDFVHWKKGEWANRTEEKQAEGQLKCTQRLLAALSHDGSDPVYLVKGVEWNVRDKAWAKNFSEVHAQHKAEWTERTQGLISKVRDYIAGDLSGLVQSTISLSTREGEQHAPQGEQAPLKSLALRIRSLATSKFVPPTLRKITVRAENRDSPDNAADDVVEGAPLVSVSSLCAALKRTNGPIARTCFVVGPAGQGKSRLAQEIAASLLEDGQPCVLIRRQELDKLHNLGQPTTLPDLLLQFGNIAGLDAGLVRRAINENRLIVIVDGWNELERRVTGLPIQQSLNDLISGQGRLSILVTSRRFWWEDEDSLPAGREFDVYRLFHLTPEQHQAFLENKGIDITQFDAWMAASELGEVCKRPFFLEQAILLFASEAPAGSAQLASRSDLMLQILQSRYRRVKSATVFGSFSSDWPQAQHLAAATALVSLRSGPNSISPGDVLRLLEAKFEMSELGSLVDNFFNIYSMDSADETAPDRFFYPHETLRDFGLALLWANSALPDFVFYEDEFEHLLGYWVGLQSDANATVEALLDHPVVLARPSLLADVLAANRSKLSEAIQSKIWHALSLGLTSRRAERDATVLALRDLPLSLRLEGVMSGLVVPTAEKWPNVGEIARDLILSARFGTHSWQRLTRQGERSNRFQLGEVKSRRGARPMERTRLELEKEGVPAHLIRQLAVTPERDRSKVLSDIFSDRNAPIELKAGAISAVGILNMRKLLPAVRSSLHSGEPQIKRAAIRSLGLLGDASVKDELMALIDEPDVNVRYSVVAALGRVGARSALPAVRKLLNDENEPRVVLSAAVSTLGLLRDRQSVGKIATFLDHENDTSRGAAITALGRIGDPTVWRQIAGRLSDKDPLNRAAAILALARLDIREVVSDLINILERDGVAHVRRNAASALGVLDAHSALKPLLSALADPDASVQAAAARSLGHIGFASTFDFGREADSLLHSTPDLSLSGLVDALGLSFDKSTASSVRREIVVAVSRIDPVNANSVIEKALDDTSPEVKRAAVRVLSRIMRPSSTERLRRYVQEQNQPQMRNEGLTALARMTRRKLDRLIYEMATLPSRSSPDWGARRKDYVAGNAVKYISRFGEGSRAVAVLTDVLLNDPGEMNRTEAVGGLSRLGRLTDDVVRRILSSGSAKHFHEANPDVRGRVCYCVLTEFVGGGTPEAGRLSAIVSHLANVHVSKQTIRTALAAIDRMSLEDAQRAEETIVETIEKNKITLSDRFATAWQYVQASLKTKHTAFDRLQSLKADATTEFLRCMA